MRKLQELNERLANANFGYVYEMGYLNEFLADWKPEEIIRSTRGTDFTMDDELFEIDGYGHLVSYPTIEDALEMYEDVE